jgi:hypothetical protein
VSVLPPLTWKGTVDPIVPPERTSLTVHPPPPPAPDRRDVPVVPAIPFAPGLTSQTLCAPVEVNPVRVHGDDVVLSKKTCVAMDRLHEHITMF